MQEITVDILETNKEWLEEKIAKLNKRAEKLGTMPVEIEYGEVELKELTREIPDGDDDYWVIGTGVQPTRSVTLRFEVPKLDGWSLVAELELMAMTDTKTFVLFRKVPDEKIPQHYLDRTEIGCDHCGVNRFRKKSYLVRKGAEFKEVGSTCVKDYLGHNVAELAYYAGMERWISDNIGEEGMGRGVETYRLNSWLMGASWLINHVGWVSKSEAYENPMKEATADLLLLIVTDPKFAATMTKQYGKPTDKDGNEADLVVEYFKNIDPKDNDYLVNARNIVQSEYVTAGTAGLATSLVISYRNAMRRKEERERRDARGESDWIGEVGERLRDVDVEVIYIRGCETRFGFSELILFVDDDGNVYKTFYSGSKWSVEKGDRVLLTGTIKKHCEYEGKKSTALTRCIVKHICYRCKGEVTVASGVMACEVCGQIQ